MVHFKHQEDANSVSWRELYIGAQRHELNYNIRLAGSSFWYEIRQFRIEDDRLGHMDSFNER